MEVSARELLSMSAKYQDRGEECSIVAGVDPEGLSEIIVTLPQHTGCITPPKSVSITRNQAKAMVELLIRALEFLDGEIK